MDSIVHDSSICDCLSAPKNHECKTLLYNFLQSFGVKTKFLCAHPLDGCSMWTEECLNQGNKSSDRTMAYKKKKLMLVCFHIWSPPNKYWNFSCLSKAYDTLFLWNSTVYVAIWVGWKKNENIDLHYSTSAMSAASFIQCRLFIIISLHSIYSYPSMVALQFLRSVKNNFSCSDEKVFLS